MPTPLPCNATDPHAAWLLYGQVQKFVVAISGVESGETLERWVFNVQTDGEVVAKGETGASSTSKDAKDIQKEIQAIVRQITASVTFLPMLEEPCAFDLLVYADKDAAVPATWEDSDPRYIQKASEVMLRSFTTTVHKVDAAVAYKNPDEDI